MHGRGVPAGPRRLPPGPRHREQARTDAAHPRLHPQPPPRAQGAHRPPSQRALPQPRGPHGVALRRHGGLRRLRAAAAGRRRGPHRRGPRRRELLRAGGGKPVRAHLEHHGRVQERLHRRRQGGPRRGRARALHVVSVRLRRGHPADGVQGSRGRVCLPHRAVPQRLRRQDHLPGHVAPPPRAPLRPPRRALRVLQGAVPTAHARRARRRRLRLPPGLLPVQVRRARAVLGRGEALPVQLLAAARGVPPELHAVRQGLRRGRALQDLLRQSPRALREWVRQAGHLQGDEKPRVGRVRPPQGERSSAPPWTHTNAHTCTHVLSDAPLQRPHTICPIAR